MFHWLHGQMDDDSAIPCTWVWQNKIPDMIEIVKELQTFSSFVQYKLPQVCNYHFFTCWAGRTLWHFHLVRRLNCSISAQVCFGKLCNQLQSSSFITRWLWREGAGGRGLMSAILHITTVLPENPCYFEVTVYYRGSKDLLLAMSKSNQHFSLMPFFLLRLIFLSDDSTTYQ